MGILNRKETEKQKHPPTGNKEQMTAGEARVKILKAAMINETAHLAKSGVNLDTISNNELKALIKDSFYRKQTAGELQLPLYDWYCEIFEPSAIAEST